MSGLRYLVLVWVLNTALGFSQGVEPLKIAFWNVENLFDLVDDPRTADEEFTPGGKKHVTPEIYALKIAHTAEVLAGLDADVVGLCEVENRRVLEDLLATLPRREYAIVHYDSPDKRGIDCALLYAPERLVVVESRPIKNRLSAGTPTRDVLYVHGRYHEQELHLFINHWPSNYGGRERALPKRAETARLVRSQVERILKQDPNAEIILMGDFNEGPDEANVTALLQGSPGASLPVKLIDLMLPMMGKPGVGTYVYRGQDLFLDQIIISPGLLDTLGLRIIPGSAVINDRPQYRQQRGAYRHYPFRFWAGDLLLGGYSDHLAVAVELETMEPEGK